jgi:hypothetical protein
VGKQGGRYSDAEQPCGLKIKDKLELARLLTGKFGSVTHQPAGIDHHALAIDYRDSVMRSSRGNLYPKAGVNRTPGSRGNRHYQKSLHEDLPIHPENASDDDACDKQIEKVRVFCEFDNGFLDLRRQQLVVGKR